MQLIGPKRDFDLVLFDELDDPDRWEQSDEDQTDLEQEALTCGMRSCERPQRIDTNPMLADMAFISAALRRRPVSSVFCAIGKAETVEVYAPNPRLTRVPVHSRQIKDWQSPNGIAAAINDVQLTMGIHTEAETWVVAGPECGIVARGLSELALVQKVVVPAHAGASTPVGLLVMDLIREHWISFGYTTGLGDGDTARLREAFRDLMDQASAEAFRLGFDTDDLVCEKYVDISVPHSSTFWRVQCGQFSTIDQIFEQFDQLRKMTGGCTFSSKMIVGASIRSTIETAKPRLPVAAQSTTIVGAGEPAARIVVGPGRMLACLCEIDVPRGWQAEWEPSGDVVMTRV